MTSSSVLALDAGLFKVDMNGQVWECSYPCSLRADVVLACDIIIRVNPKSWVSAKGQHGEPRLASEQVDHLKLSVLVCLAMSSRLLTPTKKKRKRKRQKKKKRKKRNG